MSFEHLYNFVRDNFNQAPVDRESDQNGFATWAFSGVSIVCQLQFGSVSTLFIMVDGVNIPVIQEYAALKRLFEQRIRDEAEASAFAALQKAVEVCKRFEPTSEREFGGE